MRDGLAQRDAAHEQVDDRLARCERPGVRRVDVSVVDEQGHAVDTGGGVAMRNAITLPICSGVCVAVPVASR